MSKKKLGANPFYYGGIGSITGRSGCSPWAAHHATLRLPEQHCDDLSVHVVVKRSTLLVSLDPRVHCAGNPLDGDGCSKGVAPSERLHGTEELTFSIN